VPENPVKFIDPNLPEPPYVREIMSEPAVMFTAGGLDTDKVPGVIDLVPVEPAYVKSITGVPRYSIAALLNTRPLLPLTVILKLTKSRVQFTAVLAVTLMTSTLEPSVTVYPFPEFASKIAISAAPGAEAPAAPPVVVDQFAVLVVSQVPAPPTQNLLAINIL
jgi:hypothetical protein